MTNVAVLDDWHGMARFSSDWSPLLPAPKSYSLHRRSTMNTMLLGYGVQQSSKEFYPQSIENALAFVDGKPVWITGSDDVASAFNAALRETDSRAQPSAGGHLTPLAAGITGHEALFIRSPRHAFPLRFAQTAFQTAG